MGIHNQGAHPFDYMKRNKPLKSKTPLKRTPMKRKPLERAPSDHGTSSKPRKPINKKSSKMATFEPLDNEARRRCKERGRCEAYAILDGPCSGVLEWAHIISRRYIATRWREDNCLCLCSHHHRMITDRPGLITMLVSSDDFYRLKSITLDVPISQFVEQEKARLLNK